MMGTLTQQDFQRLLEFRVALRRFRVCLTAESRRSAGELRDGDLGGG
jgi:hypothetical protein